MYGYHEVALFPIPGTDGSPAALPTGWKPFAMAGSYYIVARKWNRLEKEVRPTELPEHPQE